jgi:hypothetical protein
MQGEEGTGMEVIIALWTFAEKNGPLSAFGLLCIVVGSWWLIKKARASWHRHKEGMSKLDDTHASIIDPVTGEIVHRADLSHDIKDLHEAMTDKMCTTNCPVMPRIVETLAEATQLLKDSIAREAGHRTEIKNMIKESYEFMNARMDKSLAERDALLSRFILAFEHFVDSSKEKRRED